jgi:hypothetical protein
MEVGRMRGRRNPQITMLAFIDLEERAPEWRSFSGLR